MSTIGEDLVCILDHLQIRQVVCFGEGAGANILARFAMAHITRVFGVCLIHMTSTTAGLLETLKEKRMKWNLDDMAMNPTAENYLILHRFGGAAAKANNKDEWKNSVEEFQEVLRKRTNPKNLKKFVEAFLKRTTITETIKRLSCPMLLVTGQLSVFNETTRTFHQAVVNSCKDKSKVDFVEVAGVANVIEEKPEKLAECFQYFLQGLGLVSSVPMHNVIGAVLRNRRMSMEDYDKPARERKLSTGTTFQTDQKGTTTVDRRMSSGVVPDRRLYPDSQTAPKPGYAMTPERRSRAIETADGLCREGLDRQPLME